MGRFLDYISLLPSLAVDRYARLADYTVPVKKDPAKSVDQVAKTEKPSQQQDTYSRVDEEIRKYRSLIG